MRKLLWADLMAVLLPIESANAKENAQVQKTRRLIIDRKIYSAPSSTSFPCAGLCPSSSLRQS